MLQADLGRKSPPRAKPREDPLAASTTFWEDVVQVSTPLGKCDTAHGGPNDKEGMRGCRRAATLVPTLKDTAAQRVNVNSCRAGASCCVLCARSSDFILLDRTNTAFSCGLVDGFLSYCQTRRFLSSKVSSTVKEDHICQPPDDCSEVHLHLLLPLQMYERQMRVEIGVLHGLQEC